MTEAYSFHLAFIFAFFYIQGCVAEECVVAVSQPDFLEESERNQTVAIHCYFSRSGKCPSTMPDVLWYQFQQRTYRKLQIQSSSKYSLEKSDNNRSLLISSIHPNDSGIYFCGISFTESDSIHSKSTSNGTILVVRAMYHMVKPYTKTLMIILTVLLFLYSVCIVVLLVLYKPITCRRDRKRPSKEKRNSTRRANFRAVAQELYNRRNPRKNKKAEETSAASTPDDPTIYQNL
ncbi:immunoglobulin superfamily member 6-like isoform X2 [Polyodon spathula]|uniref:immunoglobulin superfamily member 6-like isoform X2 n=1 Tax=Polyodon spathula TaxID=7913 RepID=UPI001B7F1A23|nr:immunoglobulin superfamily member 6-like isoform X2 [Polyodon spathula]